MKLILTETRYGTVHVSTEAGALFFTIEPGANSSTYARIKSRLPGLMESDARTMDDAVERCVSGLGRWMRLHLEGRVPIEVVDERDKDRRPWRTAFGDGT